MRCAPLLRLIVVALLLALGAVGRVAAMVASAGPVPAPCTAPPYRQFDFWLGDWDVMDFGGTERVAHVRAEAILGGCVVHEVYTGADGHRGESFSVFDAARQVWHQSWVTNRAELLVIEGTFRSGAMELAGAEHLAGGREKLVRGTWKPTPGGVREIATTSVDGGKTWQPWFDLMFVPSRP